jgi:hypothetical protein
MHFYARRGKRGRELTTGETERDTERERERERVRDRASEEKEIVSVQRSKHLHKDIMEM